MFQHRVPTALTSISRRPSPPPKLSRPTMTRRYIIGETTKQATELAPDQSRADRRSSNRHRGKRSSHRNVTYPNLEQLPGGKPEAGDGDGETTHYCPPEEWQRDPDEGDTTTYSQSLRAGRITRHQYRYVPPSERPSSQQTEITALSPVSHNREFK